MYIPLEKYNLEQVCNNIHTMACENSSLRYRKLSRINVISMNREPLYLLSLFFGSRPQKKVVHIDCIHIIDYEQNFKNRLPVLAFLLRLDMRRKAGPTGPGEQSADRAHSLRRFTRRRDPMQNRQCLWRPIPDLLRKSAIPVSLGKFVSKTDGHSGLSSNLFWYIMFVLI